YSNWYVPPDQVSDAAVSLPTLVPGDRVVAAAIVTGPAILPFPPSVPAVKLSVPVPVPLVPLTRSVPAPDFVRVVAVGIARPLTANVWLVPTVTPALPVTVIRSAVLVTGAPALLSVSEDPVA